VLMSIGFLVFFVALVVVVVWASMCSWFVLVLVMLFSSLGACFQYNLLIKIKKYVRQMTKRKTYTICN
jgi:hypothetical protein